MLVRPGDVMPARLQHPSQRSHRGATDSNQVIIHFAINKTCEENNGRYRGKG